MQKFVPVHNKPTDLSRLRVIDLVDEPVELISHLLGGDAGRGALEVLDYEQTTFDQLLQTEMFTTVSLARSTHHR